MIVTLADEMCWLPSIVSIKYCQCILSQSGVANQLQVLQCGFLSDQLKIISNKTAFIWSFTLHKQTILLFQVTPWEACQAERLLGPDAQT